MRKESRESEWKKDRKRQKGPKKIRKSKIENQKSKIKNKKIKLRKEKGKKEKEKNNSRRGLTPVTGDWGIGGEKEKGSGVDYKRMERLAAAAWEKQKVGRAQMWLEDRRAGPERGFEAVWYQCRIYRQLGWPGESALQPYSQLPDFSLNCSGLFLR